MFPQGRQKCARKWSRVMGWEVKVVAWDTIQKPQEMGRAHIKKCCDRQNEIKLEKNKRKKRVNSSTQQVH